MTEPRQTATLLVVDDEPLNRKLLHDRLEPEGYRVLQAETGPQALELLAREPVDLVLLDVRMPGMDGLEVCRRLRAQPREGFLPVILVTGLSSQDDRHLGFAAGADEFISKPIDLRELLLRVRALVRLRHQDRTIRAQVEHAREQEAVIRRQLEELHHLAELKDDLFTLLVHDLRNPLTGLAGFAGLLEEELNASGSERARSLVSKVRASSQRLEALLVDLLEVRRLEQQELPLQLDAAGMGDVANEAAHSLEGAAAARGVSLQVVSDGRLEAVMDRALVRRALENLVRNAVTVSPRGSPIAIVARADGDHARVQVEDRGPGVASAHKARLFHKFSSLNPAGPRRGFGLGLHLVRLVAEAHGGQAFVEDRPGGGAVFGLTIPRQAARVNA